MESFPKQMEQNPPRNRWQAKVSTKLNKATADQVWALYLDFFNFHKWFPTLTTCYGVHGTSGEPGCIRFCQGFSIPSSAAGGGGSSSSFSWSKERLVSVDAAGRCLSYEIVESNIGFESYVSSVRIVPGEREGAGCAIEWSFGVDPVDGVELEDLVVKYQVGLERTAQKMEDGLYGSGQAD